VSGATTTLPGSLPESATTPAGSFRERAAEFLLVGGVTLVLLPLSWIARRSLGADAAEDAIDFVAFHAAVVINNPHFAVTYLLFYKHVRERANGRSFSIAQRARYVIAGLVVPIVLALWAGGALAARSAQGIGWLVEAMFVLVGWHYVKQGFGILTVLSARHGVRFGGGERWVFLVHAFAGWAFAWANPSGPGREVMEKGVIYTSLPHPRWFEVGTGVVFGLSTLALLAILIRKRAREGRWVPVGPMTGYLVSIWLWSVLSGVDRLMMYVIPALHSVQYLYVVWLLKRNEARSEEGPPLFGKPVGVRLARVAIASIGLGWLLFRGVPGFLDEARTLSPTGGVRTTDLGATPYFAAIFLFVNIHHYFMDHVIWRRENPDTRHLRGGAGSPLP
jgi:hypothetical protein